MISYIRNSPLLRSCGPVSAKSKLLSNLRLTPIGLTSTFAVSRCPNDYKYDDTGVLDVPQLLIQRGIHHHTKTPHSKVCSDAKAALLLSGLKDGDTVAVGMNWFHSFIIIC